VIPVLAPQGGWAQLEQQRLPGAVVLERMEAGFEQALARQPLCARELRIAGRSVRLEFAGERLVPLLTAALAHLAAPCGAEPALVIRIWDAKTTGVVPRLPRRPSGGLGLQRKAAGPGAVRRFYSELSQALYAFDTEQRRALCWFEDDSLRSWDIGAPLRPIFAWWAELLDAQLAHGAVVGTAAGAVLLAGKGGSGKSTTALSCFEAGLLLAGDDYVLIDRAQPHIAHSLYCTVKLAATELEQRFPQLAQRVIACGTPGDKRVVSLASRAGTGLASRLQLRAVAAHGIANDGAGALRDASAIEVLRALAPSSLLQLPGPAPRGLQRLGELVRGLPRFRFTAGRSSAANAHQVRLLLERSAG
jgi:hypothetical protein